MNNYLDKNNNHINDAVEQTPPRMLRRVINNESTNDLHKVLN